MSSSSSDAAANAASACPPCPRCGYPAAPRLPRPSPRLLAAATAGAVLANLPLLRTWCLNWGATEEELDATLPGDELVPDADLISTRAIAIGAPAEAVWPWIAQLGQSRGGLYSYDVLENLVGCDMHSAETVVDEWQHPQVGDPFYLHPQAPPLTTAIVDPGRALVVRGAVGPGTKPPPYDFSWAFVLRRRTEQGCRLVVRERYAYTRRRVAFMVEPVAVVSFVMSQKMLRGVRDRAMRVSP